MSPTCTARFLANTTTGASDLAALQQHSPSHCAVLVPGFVQSFDERGSKSRCAVRPNLTPRGLLDSQTKAESETLLYSAQHCRRNERTSS